ncbi:L,D-transpeptidase family protein [Haloimpatiens lingqiaonensis]|uniref:L,D-transpeptidase family protein n=1 Tax=Haloimpatiens lingqiaonensis TaxID=1380675 RepID=UPI0010FED7A7|nr:peptidoglycan binding domain-containing protein [Haloimpatiens lingqiaonensis]
MRRQKRKRKSFILPISISVGIIIIYLSMALFFKNHFYFKTTINGIKASGKTVEEVIGQIEADVKNYTLQLNGRNGVTEKISAKDFSLKYNSNDEIKKLKETQNPLNLFGGVFKKHQYKIPKTISYNENQLKEYVDKMSFFKEKNIINPKNASLEYTDKGYKVVKEVMGTKVNKDVLYKEIKDAIISSTDIINLEESNCYINPKYTSKSKEVTEAQKTMNKYLQSKITYDIRGNTEVLDSSSIKDLISVDENFNVSISNSKIWQYVNKLAYTYDTVGKPKDFVTSSGEHIKVNGGSYGWKISRSKEVENLVQAIKDGKAITKKPAYSQTVNSTGPNEIGNSYVEIDLTKQHLWVYINGSPVVDGDVVTGNVSKNTPTPEGVYKLNYKEKDSVLKGDDYETPVSFWMPFNGGIGMHDAIWRKEFGGKIYEKKGSHGCVNCPYDLAKAIFENVKTGTPVVCHV